MRRNLLVMLCLIAGSNYLFTQVTSKPTIAFEKHVLANGLTVLLHEDHTSPLVTVSVMYHVGSKNESPERTGFAHFFEHLLFEGSENIGRGQYAKYVEEAGGTLNANTSNDRTFYYELLPSNELELGLWLESERMLHAVVKEEGIETQREVVKEERRERIDNRPYGSIVQETMKRCFSVHPYRWPVIGSMEHLNAATEADYVHFYQTFYVPNNAVLSIAGDIETEEALLLAKKYFEAIPQGTNAIPVPAVNEPDLGGEIRDTIYDNIQLPAVIQAYRIPAQGTPDFYAVSMLSKLLSEGGSSRLQRSLVEESQVAVFTGAFPFPLEHPGITLAFAVCNAGVSPAETEALMDAEYIRAATELISDRDLQKLRNQVENEFVSGNASIAGIAESLANYEMYFGDANLINTEIDKYMDVSKADIQRVAKQYFNKNNRVVLYYLPKGEQ